MAPSVQIITTESAVFTAQGATAVFTSRRGAFLAELAPLAETGGAAFSGRTGRKELDDVAASLTANDAA